MRQAELDLTFTELRAPVTGRIGDRRVTPGNLVTGGTGGNTTMLATIVSIDPIRFEFTFDEASLLRYERLARNGKDVTGRTAPSQVRLKLIDEPDFSHNGRMDFIDNVIERGTGTIRGRAQFANADGLFTPGMFARVQRAGVGAVRRADGSRRRDRHRAGAQIRAGGRPDNVARQKYRHAGRCQRRAARDQGRPRAGRPRRRQRPDARAPGQKVTPKDQSAPSQAAAPQASSPQASSK